MFNLFGRKSVEMQPTATISTPKKDYPAVVEQIHNEYFTAGDAILDEATSLLKELEVKDLNKGKRLAACGFGKTREAVVAIETENKLATTKEIAELVLYYQTNYPNNKFITEVQVKAICEKYGLVCGDTTMYKGFVPENKLSLIELFKLKKSDVPFISVYDREGEFLGSIKKSQCNDNLANYMSRENEYYYITNTGGGSPNYGWGLSPDYEKYKHLEFVQGRTEKPKLKICAPLKDMEIPSGKRIDGYKIKDIPDPVVLQPVNGGYLIICAWGDEASDEIVVNEKMN